MSLLNFLLQVFRSTCQFFQSEFRHGFGSVVCKIGMYVLNQAYVQEHREFNLIHWIFSCQSNANWTCSFHKHLSNWWMRAEFSSNARPFPLFNLHVFDFSLPLCVVVQQNCVEVFLIFEVFRSLELFGEAFLTALSPISFPLIPAQAEIYTKMSLLPWHITILETSIISRARPSLVIEISRMIPMALKRSGEVTDCKGCTLAI